MRSACCFMLGLLSCYNPDYSRIRCGDDDSACPPGWGCVGGSCQERASSSEGGTMMPDALPGGAEGCRDKVGLPLGTMERSVYGCPGKFAKGKAESLCARGYKICGEGTMLMGSVCQAYLGFFTSSLRVRLNGEAFECSMVGSGTDMFAGCGLFRTLDLDTREVHAECGSLRSALACIHFGAGACADGLGGAENTNAANGVLCCR